MECIIYNHKPYNIIIS